MSEHPIGNLMTETMAKIKEMVDVNTIIGSPITAADGTTVIPVSRVSFGFGAGGSDFASKHAQAGAPMAFGGGGGAGVTVVGRTGADILLTMTEGYISRPGQLSTGDKKQGSMQFTITSAEDETANLSSSLSSLF